MFKFLLATSTLPVALLSKFNGSLLFEAHVHGQTINVLQYTSVIRIKLAFVVVDVDVEETRTLLI